MTLMGPFTSQAVGPLKTRPDETSPPLVAYTIPFSTCFTTPSLDFKRIYDHLSGLSENYMQSNTGAVSETRRKGASQGTSDTPQLSSSHIQFQQIMNAFNALTNHTNHMGVTSKGFRMDDGITSSTPFANKHVNIQERLSLHPFDPTLSHHQKALYYELRGRVFQTAGYLTEAISDYGKALLLEPTLDLWCIMGDLYMDAAEKKDSDLQKVSERTFGAKADEGHSIEPTHILIHQSHDQLIRRCHGCYARGLNIAQQLNNSQRIINAKIKLAMSYRRFKKDNQSDKLLNQALWEFESLSADSTSLSHDVQFNLFFGSGITKANLYYQSNRLLDAKSGVFFLNKAHGLRPSDPDVLMHLVNLSTKLLDFDASMIYITKLFGIHDEVHHQSVVEIYNMTVIYQRFLLQAMSKGRFNTMPRKREPSLSRKVPVVDVVSLASISKSPAEADSFNELKNTRVSITLIQSLKAFLGNSMTWMAVDMVDCSIVAVYFAEEMQDMAFKKGDEILVTSPMVLNVSLSSTSLPGYPFVPHTDANCVVLYVSDIQTCLCNGASVIFGSALKNA